MSHIACAATPKPGIGSNFIVKIDERSLPGGLEVVTENPRVVRLTEGKLTSADFGVRRLRSMRIDLLAEAWKVQLFCLGHRKVPTGVESEGERLVLVNSDHEGARAFTLNLDQTPPSPEECVLRSRPLNSV